MMDFSFESLMKAKAELEKIGPIQREIELTHEELAALKKVIPTVTVPAPSSFAGLKIKLVDRPDIELRNMMFGVLVPTKQLRPPFQSREVDMIRRIRPIT